MEYEEWADMNYSPTILMMLPPAEYIEHWARPARCRRGGRSQYMCKQYHYAETEDKRFDSGLHCVGAN